MAMMKFEILFKSSDPAAARTFYDAQSARPLAMLVKRVGEKVTDYLVCKPFAGDAYDRVADQIMSVDVAHREDIADVDPANNPGLAEAARVGVVDGLILEFTNADGTIGVFSDDGEYVHNMLNEAEVVEADGSHSNDGAHRAREGWAPSQLAPTGQAFEDYKRGGHSEGNSLN